MSSSQAGSTQPFSDISQPGADLMQLVGSLPETGGPTDLASVRLFARCHAIKRYVSIRSYPDRTPATTLDHDILAVSQSARAIGCDIEIPALSANIFGTHLRLYFDPAQDAVTAQNASYEWTVTLQPTASPSSRRHLAQRQQISLQPGSWTIVSSSPTEVTSPSIVMLDLCLRPRNFFLSTSPSAPAERAGSKRRQDDPALSSKKQRAAASSRHVLSSTVSHPLLEVTDGGTVQLTGNGRNDNYQLSRRQHLTSTKSATLYTADYSLRPGQVVVTKALKLSHGTRSTAEQWHREVSTHEGVGQHPRIVRLYGFDARCFTLYMEHVDSPSLLEHRDRWNMCTVSHAAFTILSDITAAIEFIHAAGLVHNDIKPGNVIYHSARGAILIDFGLGGPVAEVTSGGTPWYLPPEYIAEKTRGPPSDVFALGVTMLWVLRKCALPDCNKEWQICDLHAGKFDDRAKAEGAMRAWLSQVESMRSALSHSEGGLENIIRAMLRREGRHDARRVVEDLNSVIL